MFLEKVKRAFFSDFFLELSVGKKTAYLGVFIALAVIANIFSVDLTESMKITFTYLVAFFAGAFLGPLMGFAVCFFGDIVAFLLPATAGMYWPLTGICSGLLAFIPGMVMTNLRFSFRGGAYVKALIAVLLMYLLITCGLGAWSNYLYVKYVVYAGREYATAFGVYLGGKIAVATVVSAVNYALVFLLLPVLNAVKGFRMRA